MRKKGFKTGNAAEDRITVRGAAENNLRSVDVDIPHNKITVITGVSGSGKTSLAFDVIFREARRRYLESFSAYARQFMDKLRRPDVAQISGLSPVIAVNRRTVFRNPRSTVGTLTEIHDFLRLLFARLGDAPGGIRLERRLFSFNSPQGACPACKGLGVEDRIDPELFISDPHKTLRQGALTLTTPNGYIIYSQVTMDVLDQVCRAHGFNVDLPWIGLTEGQKDIVLNGSDRILIPYGKHPLASRLRWKGITARPRQEGRYKGILPVMETILRQKRNKNILRFARSLTCRACGGSRLKAQALRVAFRGLNIAGLARLTLKQIDGFFRDLNFNDREKAVGSPIRDAILRRTALLSRLGLDYLTLDRESTTLSVGEAQRLRLATQAGSGLRGVLYVLDEPSAGLHPADTDKLLQVLQTLRDNGNTVIIVEHDEACIRFADQLIDLGPGAGIHGGRVLYSGPAADIFGLPRGSSLTRDYLAGNLAIPVPRSRRKGIGTIAMQGARKHNLKNINVIFHLGAFNVVTGVSGAGKSTLVKHILAHRLEEGRLGPGPDADGIQIVGRIGKVIEIDQSPIGRTPRSNPATYTKMSDRIRDLFAGLPESVARGWGKGRFSFNVPGGRCESCQGAGLLQVGMHFLGDVEVVCPDCNSRRFNDETLEVRWRGKNVSQVLEMSVEEAAEFFHDQPSIRRFLDILLRLGLGYLKLGQSSTSLSGGEAQRIKLAAELGRPESGGSLYILDEPTTGLHLNDVKNLLGPLHELAAKGNTIIAIEHHPDFIKTADRVIDLGPGSGEDGGRMVIAGTPEDVAAAAGSLTGKALREVLEPSERARLGPRRPAELAGGHPLSSPAFTSVLSPGGPILLKGVSTNNLRDIDVSIPFNRLTVVTGPSGSGKSSLAFDTLYAESLQRYIESFSAYIRSLISKGGKAELASAWGLTPPIAISQKTAGHHPRSTVGTMTEIYDDYRLLYSRAGKVPPNTSGRPLSASQFSFNHEQGACPQCKGLGSLTVCDPDRLVTSPEKSLLDGALDGTKTGRFYGDPHGQYAAALKASGQAAAVDFSVPYSRLSDAARRLALFGSGNRVYEVVWAYKRKTRSGEFRFQGPWKGFANLVNEEYERKHADHRGEAMRPLMREERCPACRGRRLKPESLAVTFLGMNIAELAALNVRSGIAFFNDTERLGRLDVRARAVTDAVREEILRRLCLIRDVGLDYLSPDRRSATLSGGEAQRLKLAGMLGAKLTGLTYVLDEPTVGLHWRDTGRLIGLLKDLSRRRNTVVVVEHDADVISSADHIIDLGPGAGKEGGKVTAQGTAADIKTNSESATGRYLSARPASLPSLPGSPGPGLIIRGAKANNLHSVDADIPSGCLTAVTGVSGSGKSSLVFDVLLESAKAGRAVNCESISGLERFRRILHLDQEPLGDNPLSTPATYTGFFEAVRELLAGTDQAKAQGFRKQHFSYLTPEGRCKACGGAGKNRISMDFLPDVWTPCEDCGGGRYNPEVLEIRLGGENSPSRGKNAADILAMTAGEAKIFFTDLNRLGQPLRTMRASLPNAGGLTAGSDRCPADAGSSATAGKPSAALQRLPAGRSRPIAAIVRSLAVLVEIGLGYIQLGQPLNTLSGGEAQRLRLASRLMKPAGETVLYLFDEPTRGLNFEDTEKLLALFARLLSQGHTLVVVEHNLDIISRAHHVLDLGPEGGDQGGLIVACGPPSVIAATAESYTGVALRNRSKQIDS